MFRKRVNHKSDIDYGTGVLPYQDLVSLAKAGVIFADEEIEDNQIQPASIDLRLGRKAWRLQASFLPGPDRAVAEKVKDFCLHEIDLSNGALLERGCVYIVPLLEALDLPQDLCGVANPKSSVGRLDIFTRLITDGAADFDVVRRGYCGNLYAEIFPRTFSVIVTAGARLNQLRITCGDSEVENAELEKLLGEQAVLDRSLSETELGTISRGVPISVDLVGINGADFVGYKARPHAPLIDINLVNHYNPMQFWEPIYSSAKRALILNPEDFYILASRESVSVPPNYAAEMVPYDALAGEFRAHYAGFFDPGFGYAATGAAGTRAVLEVRSHGVPFTIEHGQLVGRLKYETLSEIPERLYGVDSGSSYQKQGLKLSKHFKICSNASEVK